MMILSIFWLFSGSEGPPGLLRVPNCSQQTAICALKSQDWIFYFGMISLWGKKGRQKNIWWLETWGSPMVPNGWHSVQWEVENKYFTIEQFRHIWENWVLLVWKVDTNLLIVWGVLTVFRLGRPPKGHEGPQRFPMHNPVWYEKSR